ncbi:MAG: nucleoside phosphorylase [bacterium]|nr:nucleoside phosphorylase [bacterium]
MKRKKYPILEFDHSPKAIIEPSQVIKPIDISEHCVLCFFQEVVTKLRKEYNAKFITNLGSGMGNHSIYQIRVNKKRLAVCHPGIGSPFAAGFLEKLIALGCKKFIACGGAGVLDKKITAGHIIIPSSAVRDEGTSYHYLPPSREVYASPKGIAAIEKALKSHKIKYLIGKTWTTDGVYRETPDKIKLRKVEGCLTVEMESAAFFAVAQFRKVVFAQILYGGDDVSGDKWDSRRWHKRISIREKLFWLAVESCLSI